MKEKTKEQKKEKKNLVGTRGRIFEGTVTKKFPHRVVVEFEKSVYVQKYERYYKRKTRLHARIPEGLEVNQGDLVQIRETRPLSKIIHFLVLKVIRKAQQESQAPEDKGDKK